jgi:hypothetical protein
MSLIVFASDITSEQARLKAAADALEAGVTACAALDPATRAGWDAFYKDLVLFAQKTAVTVPWPWESNVVLATANTGDTVMAYEKQLEAWQQVLTPICNLKGPGFEKFQPTPLVPDSLTTVLRYAGIGAAFVAAAVVAVKVLAYVPRPAPRALSAKRAA